MANLRPPSGFAGAWLTLGDEGYEGARVIYARQQMRHPTVIAQCTNVPDVQAALEFARERGLEIAVRCGGHHAAGSASVEGGIVIDLRLMNSVVVDAETSTAWIGGGTLAGQLVEVAAQFGLAGVTGLTPSVGLGGLLLHLGEGYLTPRYGYGTDQVLALEVVTAAGDVLQVAPDSHPDLFWAMRGAGSNFGVVTSIKIRLHPMPASVLGGMIVFAGDDVAAVTDYVWDVLENGSMDYFPDVIYAIEDGRPAVRILLGHLGPEDEAEQEIARLRALGTAVTDSVGRMSYRDLVLLLDDARSDFVAWDTFRFPFGADRGNQKETLLREHSRLPASPTATPAFVLWRTLQGGTADPPSSAPRRPGITVHMTTTWSGADDEVGQLEWLTGAAAAVVNAGADDAGNTLNHYTTITDDRVRRIYSDETYERLSQLKATYDPSNVFRRTCNIPPARNDP